MCLAIPMQVSRIEGLDALCTARDVERRVSLFLMQGEPVEPGDFVSVQSGYATRKISAEEARAAWELFDQILAGDATHA